MLSHFKRFDNFVCLNKTNTNMIGIVVYKLTNTFRSEENVVVFTGIIILLSHICIDVSFHDRGYLQYK